MSTETNPLLKNWEVNRLLTETGSGVKCGEEYVLYANYLGRTAADNWAIACLAAAAPEMLEALEQELEGRVSVFNYLMETKQKDCAILRRKVLDLLGYKNEGEDLLKTTYAILKAKGQ